MNTTALLLKTSFVIQCWVLLVISHTNVFLTGCLNILNLCAYCRNQVTSLTLFAESWNLADPNFLVSIDEDAANDSRERKLFFAKFWGPCFSQVVQLKSSSCSPVSDYFGCTGEPLFLILKSFRVIYMLISRKHHSSKSKNTVKHPPQHSLLV